MQLLWIRTKGGHTVQEAVAIIIQANVSNVGRKAIGPALVRMTGHLLSERKALHHLIEHASSVGRKGTLAMFALTTVLFAGRNPATQVGLHVISAIKKDTMPMHALGTTVKVH